MERQLGWLRTDVLIAEMFNDTGLNCQFRRGGRILASIAFTRD